MPHTSTPVLAINALEEELRSAAELCRSRDAGLEVTAFAWPSTLDGDVRAAVERHAEALAGVEPIFCHGPFLDLYPTSPDPRIVAVARKRHERALEAAAALGARICVAHLNSIPLINNREYRARFASAAADFWTEMADRAEASGIVVALENMWEEGPELQKAVVTKAGHRHLKASFDNGHALVFSSRPAADWIEALGQDLAHLHLHDNDGSYDEHRPPGEGVEAWPALIRAWREHAPGAALVVECDALDENRRGLEAVRAMLRDAASEQPAR